VTAAAPSNVDENSEYPFFYSGSAKVATKKSSRRSKRSALKRPSRQSAKRKRRRAPTKSCARELFVYNGQNLLGVIKIAGAGKATAYNPDGKQLGTFASQHAAIAALGRPAVRP
jgi:hypothetical protein